MLETIAANFVRSLVAFTISWGLDNAVDPLSSLLGRLEKIFSRALVEWLVQAIKVAAVFIGAATVLEIWGIQVGPLIAGLGLFGVNVALGAQDLFKNLIAGIPVTAETRFMPGDWIRVDDVVEGTVASIGFRSSRAPKVATFLRIDKFSDSSIEIMLYCFTVTTNWGEWLEIKERPAYKIKGIVEGAGTACAFPSRSLYVETLPSEVPEPFVPPAD